MRSLLRRQFRESWEKALKDDYENQRINSERSLQAAVWARLSKRLNPKTRRMFIEPVVKCGTERRFPDLVVCNSRQIIGIVELKYLPRSRPHFGKDMRTFRWLLKNRTKVSVSNLRYRGSMSEPRRYGMAKNVLFAWAGVHAKCDPEWFDDVPSELGGHFLLLHAETEDGGNIQFW